MWLWISTSQPDLIQLYFWKKKSFSSKSPGVSLKCRQPGIAILSVASSTSLPASKFWLYLPLQGLWTKDPTQHRCGCVFLFLNGKSLHIRKLFSESNQATHVKSLEQCPIHNQPSVNTTGCYLCNYESYLLHGHGLCEITHNVSKKPGSSYSLALSSMVC